MLLWDYTRLDLLTIGNNSSRLVPRPSCIHTVYLPVRHFNYVSLDDPDYVSDDVNVNFRLNVKMLL